MTFDEFTSAVFEEALRMGCTAAEVYFVEGDSAEIGVLEGELDQYSVSHNFGLNLRVEYDGRNGYAYTETFENPSELAKKAIDNACAIESADAHPMQGKSEYADIPEAENPLFELDRKQRIELAKEIERAAKAKDGRVIRVSTSEIASDDSTVIIRNTLGLDAKKREALSYSLVGAILSQNGEMKNAYSFRSGKEALDIDKLVTEAVDNAAAQFGASPVAAGEYDVIIKNEAMADLLNAFSPMFSAENAQKGLSPLNGKEGETVASELITILDDPFYPEFARAFDAEGVPSVKKAVVEKGTLKTLLHNLKTAKRAGVESTSNASRARLTSPIGVSPSVFYIEPGETSYDELVKKLGNGLIITELAGLHSGVNTVSDEFSLLASGRLVENGKIVRSVEQITIAGSFLETMRNVDTLGSDLKFGIPVGSIIGSPSILVKGAHISGK